MTMEGGPLAQAEASTKRPFLERLCHPIIQHSRGILLVGGVLIFLLFGIPFLLSKYGDPTNFAFENWFEVLSGNWSPGGYPTIAAKTPHVKVVLTAPQLYWFSFFGVFAVFLNNAALFLIASGVWRWAKERRELMPMKLSQALRMRDVEMEVTVTDQITEVIPSEYAQAATEVIHRAIVDARESWENRTLTEVYGAEKAKRIRDQLNRLRLD